MRSIPLPHFDNDIALPKTGNGLRKLTRDTSGPVISALGHKDRAYPRQVILSMEPGQSFFIPLEGDDAIKFRMRMLVTASRWDCEMTSKATTTDGVEGVRFWKISGPVAG